MPSISEALQNTEIDDVTKTTIDYFIKTYKSYLISSFVALVLVNLAILSVAGNPKYLFVLDFIAVISPFLILSVIRQKVFVVQMQQVAKTLNYTYTPKGDLKSLSGGVFGIGHARKIKNVFSGSYNGFPVRIFDYWFKKGFGKNSPRFGFTFFEIRFNSKVPAIIASSKKSILSSVTSTKNIEKEIFKGEPVDLEGNFSKYFSIRVEKDHQREAREIFTPDMMADMIDKAGAFSFIFYDDKLYICCRNFFSDSNTFSKNELLRINELVLYFVSKWTPAILHPDNQ